MARGTHELGVGVKCLVVPDGRDIVALACDGSRGAPVAGLGAGDRLAARVDEVVAAVDPERQFDRRVVEASATIARRPAASGLPAMRPVSRFRALPAKKLA